MLWLSIEQDYFGMNYIEDRDPDKIHIFICRSFNRLHPIQQYLTIW